MSELVQANWVLFVIALLLGIAVAYWTFVANRKTRVITTKPDVLDEGAEPARRNQALIDTPSAALKVPPAPQPAAEPILAAEPAVAPAPPQVGPGRDPGGRDILPCPVPALAGPVHHQGPLPQAPVRERRGIDAQP